MCVRMGYHLHVYSNLPFYLVSAFAESAFPVSGRKLVDLRFHYVVQQTPKQKKID